MNFSNDIEKKIGVNKEKSPIKIIDNKIIIKEDSAFQQMGDVFIAVSIIAVVGFSLYYFTAGGRDPKLTLSLLTITALPLLCTAIVFGFQGRYVFDISKKEIIREKHIFFALTTSRIAYFNDINMLGVSCFIVNYRGSYRDYYKLVIAYKSKPNQMITLINGQGISFFLSRDQLNYICLLLAETTSCPTVITSDSKTSIEAVKKAINQVEYKLIPATFGRLS